MPPLPPPPPPAQAAAARRAIHDQRAGASRRNPQARPKATVIVEGTAIEATTDNDGRFTLTNVPPASRHVIIAAPGLMPLRVELTLSTGGAAPLDALLDTEVHYTEVVSVSPDARDTVRVLSAHVGARGQDLNRELEATLGATLAGPAGRRGAVASARALAAGDPRPRRRSRADPPGRPAHGRSVQPVGRPRRDGQSGGGAAHRGRARAGDAALRRQRHRRAGQRHHRTASPRASQGRARHRRSFDLGHGRAARRRRRRRARRQRPLGAACRRQRRSATATSTRPRATVDNSQSRSGFGNVGLSWTGAKGYVGGSYGYDDTKYGIPVVEEGQIELTPRRHVVLAARRRRRTSAGSFDVVRADAGACAATSTTSSKAARSARGSTNDTIELDLLARAPADRPADGQRSAAGC